MSDYTPATTAGTSKANKWTATQTFQPGTSESAIALQGNQTTTSAAMAKVVYTAADQNGLGSGSYPLIQATYGTDLYFGVQAGNANDGTSFNSNVGVGYQSLYSNTSGAYNNSIGCQAMYDNTTGANNSACGFNALYHNTSGIQNTALGYQAATGNTTGQANVAVGFNSLLSNSVGGYNTACGYEALYSNTASDNTAVGTSALYSNTTGNYNVGAGENALFYNTTGAQNTAVGTNSLEKNTTGDYNTAVGYQAANNSTTGSNNLSVGVGALYANTTGGVNLALGNGALYQYNNSGGGSGNLIAVGYHAGYNYTGTEAGNIILGLNNGVAGESNMIRLGNANSGVTGQGQVAFSQIGLSGLGLAPIYGAGLLVSLGTASTTVASYTPTSSTGQSFEVKWRLSCVTASTPTLSLTYTDPKAGAQTITLYNSAMSDSTVTSGSYPLVATSAAAITVSGKDGTAADYIYATVEILQYQ